VRLVESDQQHESYDPNRDQNIRGITAKLDLPRKPAPTSDLNQNPEGGDRSEEELKVFRIEPPEPKQEHCKCSK
jgi:hypothetical protein